MNYLFISIFLLLICSNLFCSESKAGSFAITRIHYSGGGDWYSDPSSLPNLLEHLQNHSNL